MLKPLQQALTKVEIRAYIENIEAKLKELPEQLDLPVNHHFSNGVYARELLIPAGTFLVGKIHKYEHLNTVIGDVSVLTEEGSGRINGYHTFVSPPGTKRVLFAHKDTVWVCYHASEEKDLEKLEDQLIAKSYDEVCFNVIDIEAIEGGCE